MEIIEKVEEGNVLRILVNSNEESLFSLLKTYLENESDVDIVGVYKEHHLINKTEFLLKTKKGKPLEVFKKALTSVKKDLASKKIK